MGWNVGPGIEEVSTQAGCLVLFVVPEGKFQRDFCNASCLSHVLVILACPCLLACWS